MAEPNLGKFRRAHGISSASAHASYGYTRWSLQAELHAVAQLGYGLDPRTIPVSALQTAMTNSAVYLAYRTVVGIMRRPDLYSITHDDPKVKAEAEAWLRPLLPRMAAAAARAFAYGTVGTVFDWTRGPLRYKVRKPGAKKGRRATSTISYFGKVFEVHPDETTIMLDEQGEFVALRVFGGEYSSRRAYLWAWDPEFGAVVGQGALRRAWRPYCEMLILQLLRNKYMERSVDSPRIVYAPEGVVKVDGVEKPVTKLAAEIVDEVRGSGTAALPSIRYKNGEGDRKYEVQTLDVPDRSDVWDKALNRAEAEVYAAFLVSSSLADLGGADGRALDGMLREHVEAIANFAVEGLQYALDEVHAKNYDVDKVEAPKALATDVGKANARKILQEVLRLANTAADGEIAFRVDVPAALDRLGIPLRDEPPDRPDLEEKAGADEPDGEEPGRPRDPQGDREERREDADTEEGEEDTGAPRDEDGEPEKGKRSASAPSPTVGGRKSPTVEELMEMSSCELARLAQSEEPGSCEAEILIHLRSQDLIRGRS